MAPQSSMKKVNALANSAASPQSAETVRDSTDVSTDADSSANAPSAADASAAQSSRERDRPALDGAANSSSQSGNQSDNQSSNQSDNQSDGADGAAARSTLKKAAAAGRAPTIKSSSAKNLSNRAPDFVPTYQPTDQSGDRIAIFIDGSNLFYAASHLNIEVDYRRLLSSLVRGRRLLRAYFYTGVDPQNEKQRGFLLWLNRHGHRVVSKELTHMPDGSRKANMHVEMAVDMIRVAEHCSTLTILGGDGNLAYALQVLSQRGVSIEVVSLQSMTSDSLIDLADSYTDLADLRDQIKR